MDLTNYALPFYVKDKEWINTGTQPIMTFNPTLEEISNFSELIKKIELQGAHLSSGIAKIVPPKEWHPRLKQPDDYSDIDSYVIEQPVLERINGSIGNYIKDNIVHRTTMTVKEFRKIAFSKKMRNPKPDLDIVELERYFWKNITRHEPIYGADTPGSLFDDEVKELNVNNLGTILDFTKENSAPLKGVTTVFLYFGMWKTTFPWHSEDMDLYSINFLHYGDPKFWYAVPPHASEKFERLAAQRFPDDAKACKAFLRHKTFIISPSLLKTYGIPYGTMVQYPGEIIVTFPKGYHMGFNIGYNCAESTNFALERWIDYGKNAVLCHCREDGVKIDMRDYIRIYRPEEWEEYWSKRKSFSDEKSKRNTKRKSQQLQHNVHCFPECRLKNVEVAKNNMEKLWYRSPLDFSAERQFNEICGFLYPHCAICQYFWPRETWFEHGKPNVSVPPCSRRYVTDQMFYKDVEINRDVYEVEDDELLVCNNCKIVVHRRCYPQKPYCSKDIKSENDGIVIKSELETPEPTCNKTLLEHPAEVETESEAENSSLKSSVWLCIRCDRACDMAVRSAYCVFCELRGGALTELNEEGRYAHIICAPEIRHGLFIVTSSNLFPKKETRASKQCDLFPTSLILSNPISMFPSSSNIPPASNQYSSNSQTLSPKKRRLSSNLSDLYHCEVCGCQGDELIRCDLCVVTGQADAAFRYHVTCAPLADIAFERIFAPTRSRAVCSFHNTQSAVIDTTRVNIDVKEEVYVCSKEDSLFGQGRITNIRESVYATVDFLDETECKELFDSEIKNCECRHFGCRGNHIPGSLVYVQWHDGLLYQAYYRNKVAVKSYDVALKEYTASEISKKTCVEISRENLYRHDEPLPHELKKVLLKY